MYMYICVCVYIYIYIYIYKAYDRYLTLSYKDLTWSYISEISVSTEHWIPNHILNVCNDIKKKNWTPNATPRSRWQKWTDGVSYLFHFIFYFFCSLPQLLAEMDGFSSSEGIVVIAATNFPEVLDKALTRPGYLCVYVCIHAYIATMHACIVY